MGHSPGGCKELDTTEYTHTVHMSSEISKDFDQNVDAWALCHRSSGFLFVCLFFLFKSSFRFTEKMRRYRDFLSSPTHTHAQPYPISTSPTRVIHL